MCAMTKYGKEISITFVSLPLIHVGMLIAPCLWWPMFCSSRLEVTLTILTRS